MWAQRDRLVEARGAWLTSLARSGLFAASLQLGSTVYLVPVGPVDVGAGAHAGVFAGLGGQAFGGFVGAQTGLEAFLRTGGPRVPARLVLGVQGQVGPVTLALTGRGGLDLEPGLASTWRAEAVLMLGWRGIPFLR